ncbi:MAG: hypothetical protein SFW36_11640 [Leptolyngbyaceae cyanobacterium bins.59]|nr:hypothetical protein [Leptolyngbyaceae cyanobacterium bins.59]
MSRCERRDGNPVGIKSKHQWVWAGQNKSNFQPIGMDVSAPIHQRMTALEAQSGSPPLESLDPQSSEAKIGVLKRLLPSARLEAIAQYQARKNRGIVLCDQRSIVLQMLILTEAETSKVLWMADRETKQLMTNLIQTYDPQKEALVVMLTAKSVQPIWVQETNELRAPDPRSLVYAPIQLPSAVNFQKQRTSEGGIVYVFLHPQLGPVGRMVMIDTAPERFEVKCELLGKEDGFMSSRTLIFEPVTQDVVKRLELRLKHRLVVT